MQARYIKRPEAAAFLSVSQRTLDGLTASGDLPFIKIGKSVRIDIRDLEALAESRRIDVRRKGGRR